MGGYPYVWFWRQREGWAVTAAGDVQPPRVFDRCRKGERCRVLARGTMNSAAIEFEDGYSVVTSRSGLRRADRGKPDG